MKSFLSASALTTLAQAASLAPRADPVNPIVKGTPSVVGILADLDLNRDSCGSVKFDTRALWVCRDSSHYDSNGIPLLSLITSTASWTEIDSVNGGSELSMYGENNDLSFYPIPDGQCNDNQAAMCDDSSRYPKWADSPPLVTSTNSDGSIVAYTWVVNSHIRPDLSDLVADPSVTLYRVEYQPGNEVDDALPAVTLVDEAFWAENEIAYGAYGSWVRDDTAYLWGQTSGGTVALARVSAVDVENKSSYEYWSNGNWTSEQPSINDTSVGIPNASAGGQGTYYYSDAWQSYVWIGQPAYSVSADFFITTAPEPQGPWIEPVKFYTGETGNFSLGAYTLQANPALTGEGKNEIYLTYTKTDSVGDDVALYTTPIIHVEWE